MNNKTSAMLCTLIFAILLIASINHAAPNGASITYNNTEEYTPQAAAGITTAGGTFTTLMLNTTTQNLRWKAYAGNISGKLTLDDGSNFTIYDWTMAVVAGEVYASRNNSINWASINCSNRTNIYTEENALNVTTANEDSINKTFINTLHKGFNIGDLTITNSTCPAIATYMNDTSQAPSETANFQEIMLHDGASMVFATLLEPNSTGFNNQKYNFQLILPEKAIPSPPTTYYFYAELG